MVSILVAILFSLFGAYGNLAHTQVGQLPTARGGYDVLGVASLEHSRHSKRADDAVRRLLLIADGPEVRFAYI